HRRFHDSLPHRFITNKSIEPPCSLHTQIGCRPTSNVIRCIGADRKSRPIRHALSSDNARNAASQPASDSRCRPWLTVSHCARPADTPGPGSMPTRRNIVGMKYANVAMRSTRTIAVAARYQARIGSGAVHAANRLTIVSNVSGTVVTYAQNMRPVFGDSDGGTPAHC